MTSDIESFRAAAKHLKKAFNAGDGDAARRLQAILSGEDKPKHADFLHVIARENGYESWPKLKFALEAAAMSRGQQAEWLKTALYFGQHWVVRKLLQGDPALPNHDLGLEIATYDLHAVREALKDPAGATAQIGTRTPILRLAFSKYIHMVPERRDDMLKIAELLIENGADTNDGFPPEPGSAHRLSALYGALGHANNLALADWLLDQVAYLLTLKPDLTYRNLYGGDALRTVLHGAEHHPGAGRGPGGHGTVPGKLAGARIGSPPPGSSFKRSIPSPSDSR